MIALLGGAIGLATRTATMTLGVVGLATAGGIGYAYGKRAGKAICTFSDRVEDAVLDALRS